jgi:hypothetical protein
VTVRPKADSSFRIFESQLDNAERRRPTSGAARPPATMASARMAILSKKVSKQSGWRVRTRGLLLPNQFHPVARGSLTPPNVAFTCDNIGNGACWLPLWLPNLAPVRVRRERLRGFAAARGGGTWPERHSRVAVGRLRDRPLIPVRLRAPRGGWIDAGTAVGAPASPSDGLWTPWTGSHRRGRRRRPPPPPHAGDGR